MSSSRLSRQTLVLRRVAEPARDQVVVLAQVYEMLLRSRSTLEPASADGDQAPAETCHSPLQLLS